MVSLTGGGEGVGKNGLPCGEKSFCLPRFFPFCGSTGGPQCRHTGPRTSMHRCRLLHAKRSMHTVGRAQYAYNLKIQYCNLHACHHDHQHILTYARRVSASPSPFSTGPPRDHGALRRHRHASATTLRFISLSPAFYNGLKKVGLAAAKAAMWINLRAQLLHSRTCSNQQQQADNPPTHFDHQ